jgi:hypothetical protein
MARPARRWFACVWLAWQLTATMAAPALVWAATMHAEDTECQCGHGPGAWCPMHKHGTPPQSRCILRSSTTDAASASLSFLGTITLEQSTTAVDLIRTTLPPRPYTSARLDRPVAPDLPPPRA